MPQRYIISAERRKSAGRGAVMLEALRLDGRRAIATGAGRGLGREMALHLAAAGADVVCAARTVGQIERTAEEVRGAGRRALALQADVAVPEQVEALAGRTIAEWGGFEIFVANAGGGGGASGKDILDISDEDWRETVDVNLSSVFYGARAAVRHFRSRPGGGNLITVASGTGMRGDPRTHVYGAAKAGVVALTRSLAVRLAREGVRANCIVPGFVLQWAIHEPGEIETARARGARIPVGRVGEAWELGPLAVYLASDASAYVTGEAFVIDGGGLAGGLAPTGWNVLDGGIAP